jgi:hypothetical protein
MDRVRPARPLIVASDLPSLENSSGIERMLSSCRREIQGLWPLGYRGWRTNPRPELDSRRGLAKRFIAIHGTNGGAGWELS